MTEIASETSDSPEETVPELVHTSGVRRFKWLYIFGMIVAVLWTAAWFLLDDESKLSFACWFVLPPLTLLLGMIWLTFLSGLPTGTKAKGLLGIVAVIALFFALVRVEDFEGDMRPRFAWRWSDTSEDRALASRQQQIDRIVANKITAPTRALEITPEDWPEFRNDDREGIVYDTTLNRDFAANPPQEIWRQPVGLGWSSFSIVDDLCFTQEQVFELELVNCYELKTGKLVWSHGAEQRWEEPVGGDGPRATPTIHNGYAYAQGATGLLSCLNAATGELIWSRNILEDAGTKNISWAMSASPLIVDDMVITNPGGANGKGVIAYDKKTGEIVWAKGDHPASYAGLRLETIHDTRQLILFDGNGAAGLDPAHGTELWRFEWKNMPQVNAAQPIIRDNQVFVSSSYNTGSALLEIEHTGNEWSMKPVWSKKNFFKLKFNDAVYKDGYVYGLDESLMSCIDMQAGKRKWKARSDTGFGELILIGDVLVILTEAGELVFAEATPEKWNELYRQPVLTGKTWNNPAFSRGYLLLRNHKEAVCLKLAISN